MKSKLNKGFTLVELIVVMALMGIIMGAVMAIMSPSRQFFNKVESTTSQESVCITAGDYLNNELRYSAGVAIYVRDSSAAKPTPPSSEFKNFIIIDNANSRTSSKKQAKGVIRKGLTSDATLTGEPAMPEAFFGEDEYNIQIAQTNTEVHSEFLMINFESYPMVYNSGSYSADKDIVYKYSKSLELVNLNNSDSIKINTKGFVYENTSTSNENVIYIFYVKPDNAVTATTTTTTTISSAPTTTTTTSSAPTTTTTTSSAPATTTTTSSAPTTTFPTSSSITTAFSEETFTVHFSSFKKEYLYGEVDSFYRVNNNDNYYFTGDFSISNGNTVKISLCSNWWSEKTSVTINYDDVNNGLRDIWIMNGSIYTSKPANWVD